MKAELSETTYIPLFIPNPERRWWQFWKPRNIWNPILNLPIFREPSEIYCGIPIIKED